jgi:vacuolar-type H+-ATPase subunit C/Vma6
MHFFWPFNITLVILKQMYIEKNCKVDKTHNLACTCMLEYHTELDINNLNITLKTNSSLKKEN